MGTSKKLVLTWWGPNLLPPSHLLQQQEVNAIMCQPDDEDTLLSEQECTGCIRLLLDQANFVADVYSECGEWLATKSYFAESF